MRLSVELVERLRAARLVSATQRTTPVIEARPVLQEVRNIPPEEYHHRHTSAFQPWQKKATGQQLQQSAFGQPAVRPPGLRQQAVRQPGHQQQTVLQPGLQQHAVRQPSHQQPAVRQPAHQQQADRQPVLRREAVQEPVEDIPASFLLPSVATRPGAQDIPKQMLLSRPFLSRQAATSSAPPLLLSSRPRTAGDLGGIAQRGRLQAEHEPATVPSLPAIAAASKGQVARPLSSERSGGAGGLSTITEATEPISFIEESLGTTASSLSEDLNTTRFGQDSQAVLWIRFQIGSVFTVQDPNLMYLDPQHYRYSHKSSEGENILDCYAYPGFIFRRVDSVDHVAMAQRSSSSNSSEATLTQGMTFYIAPSYFIIFYFIFCFKTG